ncbi:PLD nuclease N-terminal domain-containing protein [Daejeonella sp.]|uniref:PLD nuclease N-terminal domain-containing protein n=1 Tax=Daejeonella sp. TaxID=2805397 RepID=UPI00398339B2
MENLLFLNLGTTEIFILILVGVIPFILTVYCLFDITRSTFKEPLNKLLWVVIVIFVPLMGSILYLIIGRSQKKSFHSVQN